jgi:hypothetical protein
VKIISSPRRPFGRGNVLASSAALFVLLVSNAQLTAQSSSFLKTIGIPKEDSLSRENEPAQPDQTLPEIKGVPQENTAQESGAPDNTGTGQAGDTPDFSGIGSSSPEKSDKGKERSAKKAKEPDQGSSQSTTAGSDQGGSPTKTGDTAQGSSSTSAIETDYKGMPNIVTTEKGLKAYGWGEYVVGGRCLCCDNSLDGDCIIVQGTNRTDKVRIKQVIDGKAEADTGDKATYFGDVDERENPRPVSIMMIEIDLKKIADIYKVVVYTIADPEKKKNYLPRCEVGYYDQFDRLQWVDKKFEGIPGHDHLDFALDRPILTKTVLLKIKSGKSRVTEVALFGTSYKDKE